MPASLEAEEYLLSCCMLDGAEVIPKCLEARIKPESFYDTKHGTIFERILSLHERQLPIDPSVIAEELKTAKRLDEIGGYAFLAQVSSRIPTLAQAGYFVEKVREQALLREIIRSATAMVEDCFSFSGGIEDFVEEQSKKLRGVLDGSVQQVEGLRGAMSFDLPPEDDPSALLGRNRYISRGDGAIIVSSSGMGKSVLQIEWAVHCALGRPFLGIESKGELTSLVIQSEDSDGDIGEVMYSLKCALQLTLEECAKVDRRVIFVRDKVNRGDRFISRLRSLVAKVKPDLVWLNPLHAFAGCDVADARELGNFLRGGLNGVNHEDKFAYMIVHHTPKPMTGKGVADKKWHEFMYDAAGSAELVNWARAVLTLKPTETEGHFNLVLAKRGKRAGVFIQTEVEGGNGLTRLELTTKIPIKHSTSSVKVEGRKSAFSIVHWEMRAPDTQDPNDKKSTGRAGRGRAFEEQYDNESLIAYYPPQSDEGHSYSAIFRFAADGCGISRATLTRRQREMKKDELIEQMEDGRWRRTARGDDLANQVLRQRL